MAESEFRPTKSALLESLAKVRDAQGWVQLSDDEVVKALEDLGLEFAPEPMPTYIDLAREQALAAMQVIGERSGGERTPLRDYIVQVADQAGWISPDPEPAPGKHGVESESERDRSRRLLDHFFVLAHRHTRYVVSDSPKMLRETLCTAQARIGNSPYDEHRKREHIDRLQRLINECDRHRPLRADPTHADLHTPTCGCECE